MAVRSGDGGICGMSALRFTGWVLVLVGIGLGLRDGLAPWLEHHSFHPISLGAVIDWLEIGPVLDDIGRLLMRDLLEPLAGWLATVWAFVALPGIGAGLLLTDRLVGRKRHRR
jgi:hypothetical protein